MERKGPTLDGVWDYVPLVINRGGRGSRFNRTDWNQGLIQSFTQHEDKAAVFLF